MQLSVRRKTCPICGAKRYAMLAHIQACARREDDRERARENKARRWPWERDA